MAAWARRVVVGIVFVAMLAGLAPPASAQEASPSGQERGAVPPADVYTPGAIDRTPKEGPVPPDMGGLLPNLLPE